MVSIENRRNSIFRWRLLPPVNHFLIKHRLINLLSTVTTSTSVGRSVGAFMIRYFNEYFPAAMIYLNEEIDTINRALIIGLTI